MASPYGNVDRSKEGERLYNPYQDLQVPIHTLYRLPTSPEFLFQEESVAQRRSWGENLTYYTGCGYLSGAIAGAGKGLFDGIKAREEGDTLKLRVNRILNASGHTGRKFGNRLGVIGLLTLGLRAASLPLGTRTMCSTACWLVLERERYSRRLRAPGLRLLPERSAGWLSESRLLESRR